MARKDRSGVKYEVLIESSLIHLGYKSNSEDGKNYIRPTSRGLSVIPETYIQPDLIVRNNCEIQAIIYVTHWSRRRNSSLKFWRTWEEASQQKIILGNQFLTINCIFEALDSISEPNIYNDSDDLPQDRDREVVFPVKLHGWDAGIGWAIVEAFDVSIVFPLEYQPTMLESPSGLYQHDPKTDLLLEQALNKTAKEYLFSQWNLLRSIRHQRNENLQKLEEIHSRFRIGLLHIYIFYRVFQTFIKDNDWKILDFIRAFTGISETQFVITDLTKTEAFKHIEIERITDAFTLLSQIYVRKGKNSETLCNVDIKKTIAIPLGVLQVKFNSDLKICLQDLTKHISESDFIETIDKAFKKFDQSYLIEEVFEDLANPNLISLKENFVRSVFSVLLKDIEELKKGFVYHVEQDSQVKRNISLHKQNWILEILIYLCGLEMEDIYSQFIPIFDRLGHSLRAHAPYGDENKLLAYLLQGKDICAHWSARGKNRTLLAEEFKLLTWQAVSETIVKSFIAKGAIIKSKDYVIKRYLESKSMRVISSDLNGIYIVIEYYLGDLCHFVFSEENENVKQSNNRICSTWLTDVIEELWGSRPLETWMTGITNNQKWFIKVISSQDGHESDKTKELAGRCRAIRLAWSHGQNPRDRTQWTFSERPLPKLALVLDGDWDANKKRNLYEAGWDWVGDVAQLGELRRLIQQDG
ncbi:hypothetical protein [Pseudanabaena sp. 'Roaring Creek']|uniref:hypothetical protein n=1 Tax=Pseudanabaena sp. 'Roaring Creek' TaxID=1681830 RepID=UPI0006D7C3C3|nr:hypothetical protein [Pseudanabaena sp. 'Roaring Creek']